MYFLLYIFVSESCYGDQASLADTVLLGYGHLPPLALFISLILLLKTKELLTLLALLFSGIILLWRDFELEQWGI